MRAFRGWAAGVVVAVVVGGAVPQEPKPAEKLSAADRQAKLKERDRLWAECLRLEQAGKLAEAVAAAEQVAAIERAVLGERHPAVADTAAALCRLHLARDDWAAARAAGRLALDILTAAYGKDDWRVTDARLALADVDRFEKMPPDDRAAARRAAGLNAEGVGLYRKGEYAKAEALIRQALAVRRRLLGDAHPDTATSLINLGSLHAALGEYAKAEPLFAEAAEVTRKAVGEAHPDYAQCLNALSTLYHTTGEYAKAGVILRRVLALYRKALGEAHPQFARGLNDLAVVYLDAGDYAKAEPLLARALDIRRKALGDAHPDTATSLTNLAGLFRATGAFTRAAPLLEQVLEVRKKAIGESHPEYARALGNLAVVYADAGDYAKAEPLLKRALEIRTKTLGADHPDTAASLNNLAGLYHDAGDYAKAEPLYRQVLDLRTKALGADHPDTAASFNNLAAVYLDGGDHAKAEPLLVRALDIRTKTLGPDHPDTATTRANLATAALAVGDAARAERLYRQALETRLGVLDRTADVQPEREQIVFTRALRGVLAGYLVAAQAAGRDPAEAYALALRWKGRVFVRQRRQRELARAAASPEAAQLADLLAATRRLAAVSGRVPTPDRAAEWKARVGELAAERTRLETELARASTAFWEQQAREALAPDRLRRLLSPGIALVDFLAYSRRTTPPGGGKVVWEEQLAAFVARPDKEVVRVELGPLAPIREAIEGWRKDTRRRRPVRKTADGDDPADPAVVLRDTLWLPVAKHLSGIGTVLVSPDVDLAKLPFAALPGSNAGTYLIEELAVAVLPVPQFLPDVVAPPPASDPSLLVIGDVDYGADPGTPASGGRRGGGWKPLPATREEASAVGGAFAATFPGGAVKALRGADATEDAVRGLLGKRRWVHLATHGFFADPAEFPAGGAAWAGTNPDRGAVAAGYLPGLLSGVVLAGANRPVDPTSDADDGVLTAEEIRLLDLRGTQTVVLSACETGLGQAAGGEGVLGLQRAFQVAGCRTTVTSLWAVDDDATRALMTRAYRNWWGGKMSKLDGLVEAQRWMLKEAKGKAAPFYWAAFVLAGDWR